MPSALQPAPRGATLVDLLDRVLDKGLVVAGDIAVSLFEFELLTIRLRLVLCSLDKAEQIGLDWWRHDAHLGPGTAAARAQRQLLRRLSRLEHRISAVAALPGARKAWRAARPPRSKGRSKVRHGH